SRVKNDGEPDDDGCNANDRHADNDDRVDVARNRCRRWCANEDAFPGAVRLLERPRRSTEFPDVVDNAGELPLLAGSPCVADGPTHRRGQEPASLFFTRPGGDLSFC
ncbi:MAG: hypothetical protein GY832_05260, partial [Chloroflexi bacterium]|nr:hypothetical protein [Chloroflexota bacterium]